MREVFNFSAGPSMLPEEVLVDVQKELLSYKGSEMSIMEMSHRGKIYEEVNAEASDLLKQLMEIPDGYKILFVQGGASMQFEAVPLNLLKNGKADYVVTGNFSEKAFKESQKFGDMMCVASSKDRNFTYIPAIEPSMFRKDADYVHICTNNTIFGTKFNKIPDTNGIPLVADMSSNILSEKMDISKFSVIYAGAQKNIGPAGVTVVIVKESLLDRAMPQCPTMLKWSTQAKENSLYNTPPTFSVYVSMKVFRWLKSIGGVPTIQKLNEQKAKYLYDFIDNSTFYKNPVDKPFRSIMNIPFTTPSEALDNAFVKEAEAQGLVALKGHRLVGGMRASIYNGMPMEGVSKLVAFMKKFETANK